MNRSYYQNLAASGVRMPIGADLVLHEESDFEAVLLDGQRLGRVFEETARRFRTPLALPIMDLMLDKVAMVGLLGVPADRAPAYHFEEPPTDEAVRIVTSEWDRPLHPRYQAQLDAIRYIAGQTDLLPMGMIIGPFSLTTKLVSDPIVPVYMAGQGITPEDDPEVATMERCLEMSTEFVLRAVEAQVRAGAKAVCVAEPAGSAFYVSPRQMEAGSDIFERYVMKANRRLKALLDKLGADLFFHCCGQLTDDMLGCYAELDPAVLSLGSSRVLWEDATIVPERTVLFGNLPSKRFYSDREMTREQVQAAANGLLGRMRGINRPFILGSECDVLDVPGCHDVIMSKVEAFMQA
jgi:uroporphyrinogen-III decarboxylase